MNNRGPLLIAFVCGMLMMAESFLDYSWLNSFAEWVQKYYIIIAAFAIVLGVAAAGIRRLISNWNKKRIARLQASK